MSQSPEPAGSERRTAARHPCELETACRPAAGGRASWPAQVRDISATGIGLIMPRRFEPGTLLSFQLESENLGGACSLLARVVHVVAQGASSWLLGCRLLGEIGDDELKAFRAERRRADGTDARAWVRSGCGVQVACQPVGSGTREAWAVTALDVAPGGLGLHSPRPVEPGSLLSVELPGAGRPPQAVLVRVIYVREAQGGGWDVGCAFASEIPAEGLSALL